MTSKGRYINDTPCFLEIFYDNFANYLFKNIHVQYNINMKVFLYTSVFLINQLYELFHNLENILDNTL